MTQTKKGPACDRRPRGSLWPEEPARRPRDDGTAAAVAAAMPRSPAPDWRVPCSCTAEAKCPTCRRWGRSLRLLDVRLRLRREAIARLRR